MLRNYHPTIQHLIIDEIIEESPGLKTFHFVPNPEKGITHLAPFRAGSCIKISIPIDGIVTGRVYSLCSSPKNPYYAITVKEKTDGFFSPYLLKHTKVGDTVSATEPSGELTYSSLHDAEQVVAIAGGTGITPFRSMARAIRDGIENFSLTILYLAKTRQEILYHEEFDELVNNTPNVRVIYVLSREVVDGYEHGHITADMIQKYAKGQCSFL